MKSRGQNGFIKAYAFYGIATDVKTDLVVMKTTRMLPVSRTIMHCVVTLPRFSRFLLSTWSYKSSLE
jgi:hypothetical protein